MNNYSIKRDKSHMQEPVVVSRIFIRMASHLLTDLGNFAPQLWRKTPRLIGSFPLP